MMPPLIFRYFHTPRFISFRHDASLSDAALITTPRQRLFLRHIDADCRLMLSPHFRFHFFHIFFHFHMIISLMPMIIFAAISFAFDAAADAAYFLYLFLLFFLSFVRRRVAECRRDKMQEAQAVVGRGRR